MPLPTPALPPGQKRQPSLGWWQICARPRGKWGKKCGGSAREAPPTATTQGLVAPSGEASTAATPPSAGAGGTGEVTPGAAQDGGARDLWCPAVALGWWQRLRELAGRPLSAEQLARRRSVDIRRGFIVGGARGGGVGRQVGGSQESAAANGQAGVLGAARGGEGGHRAVAAVAPSPP